MTRPEERPDMQMVCVCGSDITKLLLVKVLRDIINNNKAITLTYIIELIYLIYF